MGASSAVLMAMFVVISGQSTVESRRFTDSAYEIASGYRERERPDDAIRVLDVAIRVAEEANDRGAEARLLALLGKSYESKRDYEAARKAHEEARTHARVAGDDRTLAIAVDGLGLSAYFRTLLAGGKDFGEARGLFSEALALREALRDERGVSESVYHLGLAAQMGGDASGAMELFERALAIAERLGDKRLIPSVLRHIASILEARGDLEGALRRHERALGFLRETGFKLGTSAELAAIADIHLRRGDARRAADLAAEALALGEEIKDPIRIADAHRMVGETRYAGGDHAAAADSFRRGLDASESVGDEETSVLLLRRLGAALAKHGDRSAGLDSLRKARERATRANLADELKAIDATVAEIGSKP
jgi:tetratricopeptide (TPR) repeat protein